MPTPLIVLGTICLLAVARAAAAGRRPARSILGSALGGIAALGAVALLAPYTGVVLPLNVFTGFAAAVLGIPGVILLLLLPLLL